MEQATVQLVVVPAFYLDHSTGRVVMARAENRILAQPFADKWNQWRQLAADTYGWELLLSAPSSGDYTRAMFRTPEDEYFLEQSMPDVAGKVDASPHQAGHAVDLSLNDMQATYSNFDYNALVALANQAGIDARLRNATKPEPWHFDDNPRQIYGTTQAAVQAVGNSTAQVQQAVYEGLERPEEIAVRRYQLQKIVLVGSAVAAAVLVGMLLTEANKTEKETAPAQLPVQTQGAVYA